MTREEITALFARRRQAWDDLDALALAADYADDATVDSPLAGGSATGREAGVEARRALSRRGGDSNRITRTPVPRIRQRQASLFMRCVPSRSGSPPDAARRG